MRLNSLRRSAAWRFGAAFALAVTLVAVLPAAEAGAAKNAAEPATSSPSPATAAKCQIPISTEALLPDGSAHPAVLGDGYGRRYTYASGFWEAVPPPGFNPLTASDATLAAYALPPRPVRADALRAWQTEWSQWKDSWRDMSPKICDPGTRNTLSNPNASSANWSGSMAVNNTTNQNTFWDVNATLAQPGFVRNTCAHTSGYSIWAGLGGWNSPRLAQTGTEVDVNNGSSTGYPFVEALNGAVDFHMMWTDVFAAAGDAVTAYVRYNASIDTMTMIVSDPAQGWSRGGGYTTMLGYSAGTFWDGTTADWITEAPAYNTLPGQPLHLFDLRQVDGSLPASFAVALANGGTPVANFPSWNIHETWPGTSTVVQGSYFDGTHAWSDPWYRCSG